MTQEPTNRNLFKKEMISALLHCDHIKDNGSRQAIVDMLPDPLQNYHTHSTPKVDVSNLVKKCLQFEAGFEELVDAVWFFEENSIAMQSVFELSPGLLDFPQNMVMKHADISELLVILSKAATDLTCYADAYQNSLANQAASLRQPTTLLEIVKLLCDCDPYFTPFPPFTFADIIARRHPVIARDLQAWKKHIQNKIEAQPVDAVAIATDTSCPTHLVIKVAPDMATFMNSKRPRYSLERYFWNSCDEWLPSAGWEPPQAVMDQKEVEIGEMELICDLEDIPEIIGHEISRLERLHGNRLKTIELFLPADLLFLPADQWPIESEGDPSKLGQKYRVAVRLLNRFESCDEDSYGRWKANWHRFLSNAMNKRMQAVHWERDHNKYDVQTLRKTLQNGKNCLALSFRPEEGGNEYKLADALFDASTPVAVMHRQAASLLITAPKKIETQIKVLMGEGSLTDLPDFVKKRRANAGLNDILRDHLTLIWDDPTRVSPEYEYV